MSEGREFLLAVTLLLVLGAWAASAQENEAGKVVDLSEFASPKTDQLTFEFDKLSTWKQLQFQAAAMVKPSILSDYQIGYSAQLADFQAEGIDEELSKAISSGEVSFTVGTLREDGSFRQLASSNYCTENSDCGKNLWNELSAAAISGEGATVRTSTNSAIVEVATKDLTIFWSSTGQINSTGSGINFFDAPKSYLKTIK